MFLNLHADMLYSIVWGDKDTYRLAFHLANKIQGFAQVSCCCDKLQLYQWIHKHNPFKHIFSFIGLEGIDVRMKLYINISKSPLFDGFLSRHGMSES